MSNVLSTGTGALIAFQRALATVSHNVANINTEGYSRQKVTFATRNATDYGYGYVGNGTRITDIGRVADQLAISRLLDMEQARLAIIFCNTKRSVDECTEALLARGYTVDRLHGDITQQMRERVLARRVDLIVLNDAPVDLRARVLRHGRLLLERDRAARIAFEVRTRNEAFDLEPVLSRYRAPRGHGHVFRRHAT